MLYLHDIQETGFTHTKGYIPDIQGWRHNEHHREPTIRHN